MTDKKNAPRGAEGRTNVCPNHITEFTIISDGYRVKFFNDSKYKGVLKVEARWYPERPNNRVLRRLTSSPAYQQALVNFCQANLQGGGYERSL